jgi:ankyrin repeat protein
VRDCQAKGDPRDQKGETPLHYAVRNRKARAVVNLVGELGIYPNPYILKQVPTPLDLAKSNGCKPIAEYLKQSGGKTTKEMEKANKTQANSGQSNETINNDSQSPTLSVRHFLHTKTSQILRGHI